ncbi:MAG: glycine/betaine ABC transporter permease, partial [Pseudomonadota bacterium]
MALAERAPAAFAPTTVLTRLSRGEQAAAIIVGLALLCAVILAVAPGVLAWPKAWTLPATAWIGSGLTAVLEAIKPAARALSGLLGYPMAGTNALLTGAPWPAVFGAILAAAWWIGGRRMGVMAVVALLFVLLSGYWAESMATLSLVAVSVPLALLIGLGAGILAFEIPAVRRGL